MGSEWAQLKWGALATLEYGKAIRGYKDAKGVYRVYGTNGPIGWHHEPLCRFPSVIIGRKGAYRGVHYSAEPFFTIDTAFYLNPITDFDIRWAYYELLTHDINAMDTGSAIPSTTRDAFYNIPVNLPPLPEQRAIAHILGSLDDKIELNRRMNETLEGMAQALFKSWFVDFDPVIDNALAAGNPIPDELQPRAVLRESLGDARKPLPEEIRGMFPSAFEFTEEMGWIPNGWKVGYVRNLGEVICGKTPPTKDLDNYGLDIPFITIPDMHGLVYVTETGKRLSKKGADTQINKYLPANAVCVSCIASPGLVVLTSEESQTNQQINSIVPTGEISPLFCYGCLSLLGMHIQNVGSGGSVFFNLSKGRFEELRIILPNRELQSAYQRHGEPIFLKILANQRHNKVLGEVRDTLLPKLLSGELRIPEAEELLERSV